MPLKLVKRPKSPNFVMRGTVRGIRIEESTGTGNRKAAEEIRIKREAEILTQSIHGRSASATFASAALSYLQNGGKVRFTAPVIRHFGTTPLIQIDSDAIDRGANKLYPTQGPATRIRCFYSVVSAILIHASKKGWCARPIIARPDLPDGRVRWISIDEADRLLDACAVHLRPVVEFMLFTGCRTGEALWLDWTCLNLSRSHVSFPKTKNGEARGVPLHPRPVASLANLSGRKGEVFRKPDGQPYSRPAADNVDDTSAGTRIKTAFKAACRRADISDFHPHDCRHTWATWHYAVNRDLIALMKLGGWKSERMVLRYAHINVDELKHTIDKLPGGKFGDSTEKKVVTI